LADLQEFAVIPFSPRFIASRIRSPEASCITHHRATIKARFDEIVVMLQGRKVEQGVNKAISTRPHLEYTELLLSSLPERDPDWLNNLLTQRAKSREMA